MRKHGDLNEETSTPPADPVRPRAIDVEALLHRIQLRSETLGPVDLSEDNLRRLKDAGRP